MNKKYLVIDASNLLHRTFFVHMATDPDLIINLTYHTTFITLNKYFKKVKPNQIIMAFDRGNWRKTFTGSDQCYSKKLYKGHRKDAMAPKVRLLYEQFLNFVSDFEQLVREHSSIICMSKDQLEADDLIGGIAEVAYKNNDDIVILSGDKDMIQLLRYNKPRINGSDKCVTILDPATNTEREHEDPDYFLFEKCIRGDSGDNVQNAFPRVRATKIKEAFINPFAQVNMFNETWINEDGRAMNVEKLFKENKLLMDLTAQPPHIRQLIFETIEYEMANPGKFSHFHFLKFLGKYELKNLSSQLTTFIPILNLKAA